MTRNVLTLYFGLFLILICNSSYAGSGFWQSGSDKIEVAIYNGITTSYEQVSGWSSKSFGTLTGSSTLELKGGVAYTYENSGDDILNVRIYYRVYKNGTTPGGYSSLALSSATYNYNFVTGNEQREYHAASVDLLSSVNSTGIWNTEFYFEADGTNSGASFNVYWGSSSSPFTATFNASTGLPVDLTSYSGHLDNQNHTNLNWQTASEINASHFNIHKSTDGDIKEYAGSVRAHGNSNEVNDYQFVDPEMLKTTTFYFLEQVDFNGQTEWFGPVKLKKTIDESLVAFFKNDNSIQIVRGDSDQAHMKLRSLDGKLIASYDLTQRDDVVSLPPLGSGIYLLEVKNEHRTEIIKLLKP